jgi:citrate lyase beta subunit
MNTELLTSFLFVPGSRPDRIGKAISSGADAVIVDLEDAVKADEKESARRSLAIFLEENLDSSVLVRVNSSDSDEHGKDLALCKEAGNVFGVMLPKASQRSEIEYVGSQTGKPVWPLIESAAGIAALPDLVMAVEATRMSIGALDLAADLELEYSSEGCAKVLDFCRAQIVLYSKIGGLGPPIESVVPTINELDEISRVASQAKQMGFGGMLAIHPKQLPDIHQAFLPSQAEVDWAERVISGSKIYGSVFQLDGKMIDAPVVKSAERISARANRS